MSRRQTILTEALYFSQRIYLRGESIILDYMGSAEYELGSPQKAFLFLGKLKHENAISEVPIKINYMNKTLEFSAIVRNDCGWDFSVPVTFKNWKENPRFNDDKYQIWLPLDPHGEVKDQPGMLIYRDNKNVRFKANGLIKTWEGHYLKSIDQEVKSETLQVKGYLLMLRGTLLDKAETLEEANNIIAAMTHRDKNLVVIRPV